MTKEEFIEKTRRQMANIKDPKRRAASRCRKDAKRFKYMALKARTSKKGPTNA